MKVEYEKKVDAAYILLVPIAPGGVAKTYPCDPAEAGGQIQLDFDHDGRLVGIEVLDASRLLPGVLLKDAERAEA